MILIDRCLQRYSACLLVCVCLFEFALPFINLRTSFFISFSLSLLPPPVRRLQHQPLFSSLASTFLAVIVHRRLHALIAVKADSVNGKTDSLLFHYFLRPIRIVGFLNFNSSIQAEKEKVMSLVRFSLVRTSGPSNGQ